MSRSFGSRIIQDIREVFEPGTPHDARPENEYVTGAESHPTQGDPAHGIPAYPEPLPGGHAYRGKEVVTPERVAVPPDKPYYSAGMAHGVVSPEHHNGRISPPHNERHMLETEDETPPHLGPYKLEPIPVYITEPGAGVHPLKQASFRQVTVKKGGDPQPIVERNPGRSAVLLLNETATGGVRLLNGPNPSNGALLPAAMTSYREIETQDQVWAVTDPSATGDQVVSIIEEYKTARG